MTRLPFAMLAALALVTDAAAQSVPADANNDGRVTAAEFQASRRSGFLRMDKDRDGRITRTEWDTLAASEPGTLLTRGFASTGQADQTSAFSEIDANGDGALTGAELDAAALVRFRSLDANRDNLISGPEIKQMQAELRRR